MRNILISLVLFGLSACKLHADFIPEREKLNDATVGVDYFEQIIILGGNVGTMTNAYGKKIFVGNLNQVDSGLYIQHCNADLHDNNCVQIRGVPTRKGMVKVRVSGIFNVSMINRPSEFDKTYTLLIKNPDGSF